MRKLAWFAFSAAAAMTLAVYLPDGIVWWALVFALAASGLFVYRFRRRAVAVLLGLAFGFCWTTGYRMLSRPAQALDGQTVMVQMTVRTYPTQLRYGSSAGVTFVADGRRERALVYLPQDEQSPEPGDVICAEVQLNATNDRYSDDASMYYRALGYSFTASVHGKYALTKAEKLPLWAIPAYLSHRMQQAIDAIFAADTAPFLRALLTGDRSRFDYAVKNDLSVSGISHVVAISGMHVSVLAALLAALLRRRRTTAFVAIPVILLFMMMTGARPSVVRASVMQILLLASGLLHREPDSPTSLGAALLLILLVNPWAVSDLGLQLSFGATAGIMLFGGRLCDKILQWFNRRMRKIARTGVVRFTAQTVGTTLGALVFTTPLIAVSYGLISLLSVVTNLLTLPVVTCCFQAGLLACLLYFAAPAAAGVLAWALNWLVRYVLAVSHLIASVPFAAVYTASIYIVFWLVFVYVLFALLLLTRNGNIWLGAGCAVFGLCVCLTLSWLEQARVQMQATVLDVGQGQCVLISADGVEAMVDCGGSDAEDAGEQASRYLLAQGKPKLDVLVLTHYDSDHAGGVVQLLDRLRVGAIYLPDVEPESPLRQQIETAAQAADVALYYPRQDQVLAYGQTELSVFAPVSTVSDNDAGLSVLCSRQGYDILITGDMSDRAEQLLLAQHTLPKVELLVAGHHGAASSTGQALLDAIRPDAVAISVGADNRYGHPAEQTLERIAASGAAIYRTDQMQTITVRR